MKAAREAIGEHIPLMLDANNAWSDLRTAELHCKAYESYNPEWIEEPFIPDDIDNPRRLGNLTSIPIATGEIETGRWRLKELMDQDNITVLQHDACVWRNYRVAAHDGHGRVIWYDGQPTLVP